MMVLRLHIMKIIFMVFCTFAFAKLDRASSEDLVDEDQLADEQQQQDQYQHQNEQAEEAWEYEPRVWLPEETLGDSYEELSEILEENSNVTSQFAQNNTNSEFKSQDGEHNFQEQVNNRGGANSSAAASSKSIRDRSYFWDSKQRRHYGKIDVSARQSEADKCTQFRVDIRETVICDKKRCDKLDFEWPKYDNQIVVIESTKFGMRFHRSEYEFSSSTKIKSSPIKPGPAGTKKLPPIKFDLFDLFKPKPTSTAAPITAAPTTTTTTTTTTTESTTTAAPTADDSPATTPESDNETTADPGDEAATSSTRDTTIADTESQDKNQTQFVTTFRLNTRRLMQKIIGFGGALSDSTCRNIKSLSPNMAKSLMEDYFGQRGLRYNIARMTMGSSDFSTTPYTNNDRPVVASDDGQGGGDDFFDDPQRRQHGARDYKKRTFDDSDDVDMTKFHLTREDYEFKLPVARQAMAISQQGIKFYSSLWSPPIWMKNNSNIVHGYLKGDVYGPYYKALAELMIKWLEAYRKQGIEFWGTTGLNEPVTGIKPFIFHNSLGITREDYVTFIKLYLGPMLRQRGFQNIKLIALDDNKGYAPRWAKAVLEDRDAAKYVSGIGIHWYMSDEYENLNFLARDYPDKFILSTEACNGYMPFQVHTLPGDWDRGVAYMYDIIKLMHKNVAGWVDWNMALDLTGGPSWAKNHVDAPVIVNAERDEYYKSPMFYAIGHFSRFVEPNSTRLDQRLAYAKYDYPLEATAFYTPKDYIVIVALNANRHRVPFKIIVDRQVVRVVNLKEESFSTIIFKWKNKNI